MGVLGGWRFCPSCAAPIEHGEGRVTCDACGFVAYANPAPTACALVVDDEGRVLLARRAHEPYAGHWDLPGGYLEESEHPLECIRRELREETGLEIEPLELEGMVMDQYGTDPDAPWTLNLYWTARAVGGDPAPADDVSELAWFRPDELPPPEELAFRNVAVILADWRDRLVDT